MAKTTWLNILTQVDEILARLGRIEKGVQMADQALTDLQNAEAAIAAAIQSAINLIQQLKTTPPGSVADSDVEAVVAQLNTAASSLSSAVAPVASSSAQAPKS
jgi:hypothetical protein